jgi:hypothetical protein
MNGIPLRLGRTLHCVSLLSQAPASLPFGRVTRHLLLKAGGALRARVSLQNKSCSRVAPRLGKRLNREATPVASGGDLRKNVGIRLNSLYLIDLKLNRAGIE